MLKGTSALALVKSSPSPAKPAKGPVDWRLLGDLLQQIAGEGDRDFLDMMAKQAQFHLQLIQSAKTLTPQD